MSGIVQPIEKGILIDGSSLMFTKVAMGIGFINFAGLYEVLVNRVGICRHLAFKPVITIHPDKRAQLGGVARDAERGGFEIVYAESEGGADDQALLRRIGALTRETVKEIVIFTCDAADFAPVLAHKARLGITVHWVATTCVDASNGRSRLSHDLTRLFRQKVFRFVDIGDYFEQISRPERFSQRHGAGLSVRH